MVDANESSTDAHSSDLLESISQLRALMAAPGDPLYCQMGDLIHALEDAAGIVSPHNHGSTERAMTQDAKLRHSTTQGTSTLGSGVQKDGFCMMCNRMDVSPSKRRVRKRKSRKPRCNSETLRLPSRASVPGEKAVLTSGGTLTRSSGRSVEHSTHSPLNASESSVDEVEDSRCERTPELTVEDMSGTDIYAKTGAGCGPPSMMPLLKSSGCSKYSTMYAAAANIDSGVSTTPVLFASHNNATTHGITGGSFSAVRYPKLWRSSQIETDTSPKICRGFAPGALATSPAGVESDSFTDNFSPAPRITRKKRLIKRMAVDVLPGTSQSVISHPIECMINHDCDMDGCTSMDMDCDEHLSATKAGLQALRRLQKLSMQHSDSSMDNDGRTSSSISSTDSEGPYSGEEAAQGDDEQSDWIFDSRAVASTSRPKSPDDEYMGVPLISMSRLSPFLHRHSPGRTCKCRHGHNPANPDQTSDGNPKGRCVISLPDSSDTDISQCSTKWRVGARPFGRRCLTKGNLLAFVTALSKKINGFLEEASDRELEVGHLKKKEKREVLRLAAFYQLDVRYESKKRKRCLVLIKPS